MTKGEVRDKIIETALAIRRLIDASSLNGEAIDTATYDELQRLVSTLHAWSILLR